jgi:gas vesicle structural protein
MVTTACDDAVVYAPRRGTLYDVLELILDRGMVIDVFIRVSLVGIEILKIDARIVVASVDTYLRFAEAVNRVNLEFDRTSQTVPELLGETAPRAVGKKSAKKAVKSVGDKVKQVVGDEDEDEDEAEEEEPSPRARSRSRSGTKARAVSGSRKRRSTED